MRRKRHKESEKQEIMQKSKGAIQKSSSAKCIETVNSKKDISLLSADK